MASIFKAVKDEQLNYLIGKVNEKLDTKVDKVTGKGLSTNDFTNALLEKLNGIADGAEVNQNAFATVTVGDQTIVADAKSDSFAIAGSENVKVTAADETVTIELQNMGTAAYKNVEFFDAAGAAAAVLGTAADTAETMTVYGVKAALDQAIVDTNSGVIGTAEDTSDKLTIHGTRKYADEKAAKALEDAQAYADQAELDAVSKAKTDLIGTAEDVATADTIYGAKADATAKADQALADAKAYADQKTAGLTGAMHFEGFKDEMPTDNTGYESGDVIIVGNVEHVFDGSAWHELGDEGSFVLKTQTVNGHALSGNIELTYADVDADQAGTAQSLINGLAHETVGEGDYVTEVTQANGKVTVTKATLPTVMPNPTALTVKNAEGTVTKTYTGSEAVEISAADLGALTEHQDISGKQDNLTWVTNEDIDAMFDGTYVVA